MKKTQIAILIGLAFGATAAAAQETTTTTGSIGIGGVFTDKANKEAWKMREYRDLRDSVLLNGEVDVDSKDYYLRFLGDNIGRDDQYLQLKGGLFNNFKYEVWNNKILHNLTLDAKTPFSGAGTDTLNFVPDPVTGRASLNTATWNTIDLVQKRDNVGAGFEWSRNSPWYLRADAAQLKTKGTRTLGVSTNLSPGGQFIEMPTPVNYTTTNFTLEGGYQTKTQQYSISWLQSKFGNGSDFVNFRNPIVSAGASLIPGLAFGDRVTTAGQDSDYRKIQLQGVWKQLPANSSLTARYGDAKLTSDFSIFNDYLTMTGALTPGATGNGGAITAVRNVAALNTPTFNGDIHYRNGALTYSSQWSKQFDTRAYYNYFEKDNKSSRVVYTLPAGATGPCDPVDRPGVVSTTCSNESTKYRRVNVGVDGGYKVNTGNRLGLGLDWTKVNPERPDFDNVKDARWTLEWRNTALESLTARVKYTNLHRRADFLEANSGANPNFAAYLDRFVRRFDMNNLDQDTWKVVLDWTPKENLDLGFETILKNNKYQQVTFGRTGDKRNEYYVTATYTVPDSWSATLFADWENIQYDGSYRQIGNLNSLDGTPGTTNPLTTAAGVNIYDPNTAPICAGNAAFPAGTLPQNFVGGPGCNFNWNSKVKSGNRSLGGAVDFPVTRGLKIRASLWLEKSDGSADFASQQNFGVPLNIPKYDAYSKTAFNLRAMYPMNKNWDLTVGYAYEKVTRDDTQYDNYQNVVWVGGNVITGAANSTPNYLAGTYANPNYTANVLFVTARYNFR